MIKDIPYCASSYLMYRTIADRSKCFSEKLPPRLYSRKGDPEKIHDSHQLEESLERQVREATKDGKAALALSGGIDSAILARFMPKGAKAYTFKCIVPGVEVTDESGRAALYAKECGLDHEVIEIEWGDVERLAPKLMRRKGAPIHSIEVQIAKASLKAKADGFERLVFGESADANYGGLSNAFSGIWTFGQWVDRYAYVMPYRVLWDWRLVTDPCERFTRSEGFVDVLEFFRNAFFLESMGSYENATSCANIALVAPYANTWLAEPLDYERIRAGENKYLIREIFERLYPGWEVPVKTPMPRPTDEWFSGWSGPARPEFRPNCVSGMSGDQKWLVWALERFLDIVDEVEAEA